MAQQTSIHVQPVKGGSEQHNKREKELDYVRKDLSHLNEYWEKDTQTDRLENIKSRYLMSTGQKMQAKATPIREAVVVIKPETTMDDLKRLSDAYRQRFGIDTFQIAIHKDEGYPKGEWKPNLHAHLVFDWTNQETGKSLKLNRQDMVEMQTITAEILQMDRGVSSDKQHLTAQQYKSFAEEAKLKKLQEQKEQEEKKRKQIKAQQEADLKAYNTKKAVKEAAKSASEGIKGFFGQSSKDKQIKALQSENKSLREQVFNLKSEQIGQQGSVIQKIDQAYKQGYSKAYEQVYSLQNQLDVAKKLSKEAQKYREDINNFQSIPIIERCLAIIRSFVFHINGHFDADDRRLLSFVMQGNEDAAESLRRAAFNMGGVICQYQYDSRWDQAERELRNIANGVREEEQQQRSRGLRR